MKPFQVITVALCKFRFAYSSGAATDLHRFPFKAKQLICVEKNNYAEGLI
jgi:hypothetical protein